ncbi:hypothetical protein AB0J21_10215 [Streptomyces sp. NPDC049954]|uniref:hypothetical protein n=1 Tax=Streptomyces sp. NPDC049954 TaxID=3155779 RepID=UPI0034354EAD
MATEGAGPAGETPGTHQSGQGRGGGDVPDEPGARRREPGPHEADGPRDQDQDADQEAARRRRRAQFLRELNEAKELRDRVQPRRARAARMRQQMRMRTFRW